MIIAAISDVTLGFGTPQLPLLVTSLLEHYRADNPVAHMIEPVQPELPVKVGQFPQFKTHSVATAQHPHSPAGRIEYIWRASQRINQIRPDVVIVCCTYCLPVLFKLKERPKRVIYYSIESIPFYGQFDVEMNRNAAPLLDLVIFPEENRAVFETRRCGFDGVRKAVLFNTVKLRKEPVAGLPASERNGRILYAGTISKEQTFARYFLSTHLNGIAIDLFGSLKFSSTAERESFVACLPPDSRYRGYLPSSELAPLRKRYGYSIVMWNPDNENQHYAAPNKFFDAIGDGVPPIAAPHPQCKLILERYGCGILMRDWSFDSFLDAVRHAMSIYATPAWIELVERCAQAVQAELTWDAQFDKIKTMV